jgi:hypothetical protein
MDGNNQFNELRSVKQSHSQPYKTAHAHIPISSLSSVISGFRRGASDIFSFLKGYEV